MIRASDRATDGFVRCVNHGDLWWQPGANFDSSIETSLMEPLQDALPRPVAGAQMVCPWCGSSLVRELRPSVVVLKS